MMTGDLAWHNSCSQFPSLTWRWLTRTSSERSCPSSRRSAQTHVVKFIRWCWGHGRTRRAGSMSCVLPPLPVWTRALCGHL
ncbi:hypothetical protein E2C01_090773 [Portunus trituberculatus]|uniref:Uncharacterized protein n=1 Tax=Portunus trituberculatus TaxID=210409 RepID=A0A5B7JMM9_PORTR|nr:hypothetical protein [Portunus trituberculatus]